MSSLKRQCPSSIWARLTVVFAVAVSVFVGLGATADAGPGAQTPPPSAQTATGGFDFGMRPWASAGSSPRSAFTFDVAPGQTVTDRVELVNSGDQPRAFYVYAADAYTTEIGGGFALHLRTDPSRDAAAWTTLPVSRYTVPARSAAVLPFQVTAPPDATPGDHTAGLVAEEVLPPAARDGSAGVVPLHRVAARLYLRVQGPVHPALQIERLTVTRHEPAIPFLGGSSTTVSFSLVNAGNVRTQLDEVDFRLTGAFGRALRDERIQRPQNGGTAPAALPDQVIPGSRLQFSRTFAGLPPIEAITAAVTVRAEDSLLHQPVSTSRSTTFWVVPWPAVALLSALVVLAVARRRRRRRRAHRSVGLSRSPGPARDDAPEDVLVA